MWAALPEGCESASPSPAATGPQLVVLDRAGAVPADELPAGSVLAVAPAPAGSADASRVEIARRALDPRPSLEARRAAGRLSAAGLDTWWLDRRDPTRRHELIRRAGRPGVRPGHHPVVLAARGGPPATMLERAAEAAGAAGLPARLRVLASGTVMAEVSVGGRPALLRIAGGAAGEALLRASDRQRRLRADGGEVASRVPETLADGRDGPVAWTLEERRPGTEPARVGEALLADCVGFLRALWAHDGGAAEPWRAGADAAVLAPVAGAHRRPVLDRVARALDERLAGVGRGWMHGDFHAGNLLAEDGHLGTVLDWDGADPGGLPVLDLLHLLAMSDPETRRLPHGARAGRLRAQVAADARIRPLAGDLDARALEALAVAYWLVRAARDVREFADRAQRPAWLEANVRAPLDDLEAAGW